MKDNKINTFVKFQVNTLARIFYSQQGYSVPAGYDFEYAKHPQEKLMWAMALESFHFWCQDTEEHQGKKKK